MFKFRCLASFPGLFQPHSQVFSSLVPRSFLASFPGLFQSRFQTFPGSSVCSVLQAIIKTGGGKGLELAKPLQLYVVDQNWKQSRSGKDAIMTEFSVKKEVSMS